MFKYANFFALGFSSDFACFFLLLNALPFVKVNENKSKIPLFQFFCAKNRQRNHFMWKHFLESEKDEKRSEERKKFNFFIFYINSEWKHFYAPNIHRQKQITLKNTRFITVHRSRRQRIVHSISGLKLQPMYDECSQANTIYLIVTCILWQFSSSDDFWWMPLEKSR